MFSTKCALYVYVHCIMARYYKNKTLELFYYIKPIRIILTFKVLIPYVTLLSYASHDSS